MIQEGEIFDVGIMRPHFSTGPMTASPPAEESPAEHGSVEQEITRLTWSVLDGSASLGDRQRLAELVNTQHAGRRRFDR